MPTPQTAFTTAEQRVQKIVQRLDDLFGAPPVWADAPEPTTDECGDPDCLCHDDAVAAREADRAEYERGPITQAEILRDQVEGLRDENVDLRERIDTLLNIKLHATDLITMIAAHEDGGDAEQLLIKDCNICGLAVEALREAVNA